MLHFGKTFVRLNYVGITENAYVRNCNVTEILT
jgi:hypothetical protein